MSDIAKKYQESFTSSLHAQGQEDPSYKENAKKELERVEMEFKKGILDQGEYVKKKSMLLRRINLPSPAFKQF